MICDKCYGSGIVHCCEGERAHPLQPTGITPKWLREIGNQLPDWDDIRGRSPDATGGLSSEAFVRELRDAWPDPQADWPVINYT